MGPNQVIGFINVSERSKSAGRSIVIGVVDEGISGRCIIAASGFMKEGS